MAAKPLIPTLDGRALDFIKITAALCMVADHIDSLWLGDRVLQLWFIGRATFPLFCYAVAAVVKKAGADEERLRRYLIRLLALALITEPVSIIARDEGQVNVVFTLAFGLLFMMLTRKTDGLKMTGLYLLAAASALLPSTMEFGFAGVMLPSALLRVMEGRKHSLPGLFLLLLVVNVPDMAHIIARQAAPFYVLGLMCTISLLGVTLLPGVFLSIGQRMAQRGRFLPRYFFYAFYPGHLLVLWALKLAFFRG